MVSNSELAGLLENAALRLQDSTKSDVSQFNLLEADAGVGWVVLLTSLVFFMQAGFSLVESGSARTRSIKNVLFKNCMDLVLGSVIWYAVGFGLAFGDGTTPNPFIGTTYFFLVPEEDFVTTKGWHFFLYQALFACTTSTIVGGAVVERVKMFTYVTFNCVLVAIVYPVVVHWVWSDHGWISPFNEDNKIEMGFIDNAGGLPVHLVGGLTAIVACVQIGPRTGLYNSNGVREKLNMSSVTSVALGCLVLWFGWFGFNGGATLSVLTAEQNGRMIAMTSIAACWAGCTGLLIGRYQQKTWDLFATLNGCIAGLIAITPCCHVVDHFGAGAVGAIATCCYVGVKWLLERYFHYDDPVDAGPLHFTCGGVGSLLVGFFAKEDLVKQSYGEDTFCKHGVLYGGDGWQLLVQVIGVGTTMAWTFLVMYTVFWLLHISVGIRVLKSVELSGLDAALHGGQEGRQTQKTIFEQLLKHKVHPAPIITAPKRAAIVNPESPRADDAGNKHLNAHGLFRKESLRIKASPSVKPAFTDISPPRRQ